MKLNKVPEDIKQVIKNEYAWPGGYPMYLVTSDGAALCPKCCKAEYRQIVYSIKHNLQDGWKVEGYDINWEDPNLYCDHCSKRIESAYAEERED